MSTTVQTPDSIGQDVSIRDSSHYTVGLISKTAI
jgi:hypothetical protein